MKGEYNKYIPKMDGMFGATISLSFSLFGYVYVLTRASFHYQSQNLIDLGKNLGFSKKKSFFKIILPSSRPAIIAGLITSCHGNFIRFWNSGFFWNVSTLTTGIYNAWIAFDDLSLANRLSFFLLIFILGLFLVENLSRKKAQYHSPTKSGFKSKTLINLSKPAALFALIFCSFIFFASFIFPISQMLYWTIIFPKHLK